MKIFLFLDSHDTDEVSEPMAAAITHWLEKSQSSAVLINAQASQGAEGTRSDWDFGMIIDTNKKATLAKPLNFLYDQAREHRQEFVVGLIDEATGRYEDICYFGYEEGKPDMFEFASYLGLPN